MTVSGRAGFVSRLARIGRFCAKSQAVLGIAALLAPAGSSARAPGVRAAKVAEEPLELRWLMGVGAERTLPKGAWVVDEGTANVEVIATAKPSKLVARRAGRATLHADGVVLRVVVAQGAFVGEGGELRSRVFYAGRTRDGAFADSAAPLRARVQFPREKSGVGPLRLVAYDANGAFVTEKLFPLETLAACTDDTGLRCVLSPPVHLVPEVIEEPDAPAGEAAMEARLGGRVALALGAEELASAPVCLEGDACAFSVSLKPVLVRAWAGGPTVFHGVVNGEREAFRERVERVLRPWESCGIRAVIAPVRVADPPRETLLSFGLPFGLPSDGREVLEVRRGKGVATVSVPAGLAPMAAAKHVQTALSAAGVRATLIARPWLAHEEAPAAELSLPASDAHVAVRAPGRLAIEITGVELRDGLEHFDDARAASGSQEERALLLPLVDRDASTVEVFAVPFFSDGRRVGESFVALDDPALVNTILIDRAGLAASRTSHVLAHELGHVLLRSGDHPDEGSRDTPRLLMDSDATDASRFGPRLITVDECARARKQGGSMPYRVLMPVPLPHGKN